MKQCNSCKLLKDKSCFRKNVHRKDGLQSCCIECRKTYNKEHYILNKRKYILRAKNRNLIQKKKFKKLIKEYLLNHPCVDCGNSDIRVLEFDHIKGNKNFCISKAHLVAFSLETIKKEISKCEVRCANCHRIRHFLGRAEAAD